MEKRLYNDTLNDIKKILDKEDLCMTFDGSYPMKLIIKPRRDLEGQMNMLGAADEETPFNSPDMTLILRYVADDVRLELFGRMAIDDEVYRKVKTKFKTACVYYMCVIHKLAMENQLLGRSAYRDAEAGAV